MASASNDNHNLSNLSEEDWKELIIDLNRQLSLYTKVYDRTLKNHPKTLAEWTDLTAWFGRWFSDILKCVEKLKKLSDVDDCKSMLVPFNVLEYKARILLNKTNKRRLSIIFADDLDKLALKNILDKLNNILDNGEKQQLAANEEMLSNPDVNEILSSYFNVVQNILNNFNDSHSKLIGSECDYLLGEIDIIRLKKLNMLN